MTFFHSHMFFMQRFFFCWSALTLFLFQLLGTKSFFQSFVILHDPNGPTAQGR